MAISFNKEVIAEAIQEVVAESTGKLKTVTGPAGKTIAQVVTPEQEMEMKKKGAKIAPMEEENLSVGHIDNEPGMLKQFAFDTAEYSVKLYKLLHHYEQMEDQVDFPNWWQQKVMMAREYMSKATHYLEFETMKPHIDAAVDGDSEEELDQELNELFGKAKDKIVNYKGHDYKILDIDNAGTFTLIDPADKDAEAFYVNKGQMKAGRVPDTDKPEVEDVPLMSLEEAKATCCGKCGRTHVKGTECKKPFLTGKDHCRVR